MIAHSNLSRGMLVAGAGCVVFLAGCQKSSQVAAADSDAVAAKLARADAVDGEEDLVVSKCAGCALGMAGKAEHALAVGQYSMHFCAAECKARFARDPGAAVLAMEIPE